MLLTPLNHSVIFVNEAKTQGKAGEKSIVEFKKEAKKNKK